MCLKEKEREKIERECVTVCLIESVSFGLIWIVFLSQCECAAITLSGLATVALAACGWRQTQLDGKQPFTVVSLQSGLPTMQVSGGYSMKELTLW